MAGLAEMLNVCDGVNRIAAAESAPPADSNEVSRLLLADATAWRGVHQRFVGTDGPQQDVAKNLRRISSDGDLTTVERCRLLTRVGKPIADSAPTSSVRMDLQRTEPVCGTLSALALTLYAIAPKSMPEQERLARASAAANTIVDQVVASPVPVDQSFLVAAAVAERLLPTEAIHVGPCRTATIRVDGEDCAVIDTECASAGVTLNELKAIINPFNWAANYVRFFTNMAGCPPHQDDKWTRILETVALPHDGQIGITTQLRFHTSEHPKGEYARIDYDLDNLNPNPAGPVKYDRGWINMWADNPTANPDLPGVRVRTKKIIRIDGYETELQEAAGHLGYSTASAEFILGSIGAPGREPFLYRGPDESSDVPETAQPVASQAGATSLDGRYFAPTAVSIWTGVVNGLMNDYADVAGRWTTGQLTVEGLADYAAKTTDHLIRAPFQFLDAMTGPRIRRTPANNPPGQAPSTPEPTNQDGGS